MDLIQIITLRILYLELFRNHKIQAAVRNHHEKENFDIIIFNCNRSFASTKQWFVDVSNGAPSPRSVGVRGMETSEIGSISGVLNIVISEGATDLYGGSSPTGPKTLAQFFAESSGPNGIPL